MANDIKIKKILRKIYNIDYSKISLRNDDEFIMQQNGVSEFTQMLRKMDTDNGIIVTAPTCGSCGVLPSVMYYLQKKKSNLKFY